MVKREAVRVKISKSYLETVVQHLYPFELSCDITRNIDSLTNKVAETADKKMNVEWTEFRLMINAVAIAD